MIDAIIFLALTQLEQYYKGLPLQVEIVNVITLHYCFQSLEQILRKLQATLTKVTFFTLRCKPFVINEPIRDLLVPYTKQYSVGTLPS